MYRLCYVLYLHPCLCVPSSFPKLNRHLCYGVHWCDHTSPHVIVWHERNVVTLHDTMTWPRVSCLCMAMGLLSKLFLTSFVGTDIVFEDGRFPCDWLQTHPNLLSKLCRVRITPSLLCNHHLSQTYTMHAHRIMSCTVNNTKVFVWHWIQESRRHSRMCMAMQSHNVSSLVHCHGWKFFLCKINCVETNHSIWTCVRV